MTAVANSVFTAAQFNQFVRDNLNETAPAKATASGGYFVADGVNSIVERRVVGATDLDVGDTAALDFADLDAPAAVGPSVTLTTGTQALVYTHCTMVNTGTGSCRAGVAVSGATTIAAALNRSITVGGAAGTYIGAGTTVFYTSGLALTPGSNTFTMKYRVGAGTGTFSDRRLIVMPL
jgi:hypothetical protein